jgi:prepilin-type N-terminal cleavage/methylation domain-containing protein/prepilin-type processing-associated H-X9-DG protein
VRRSPPGAQALARYKGELALLGQSQVCAPRRGITLAELLAVVAILAVLAGLLVPAVNMVRRAATRAVCASHQRQLGLAFVGYAQEWDGFLPADGVLGARDAARSPAWFDRLPDLLDGDKDQGVFQCPGFRYLASGRFGAASPKSLKMNAYLDADGRPSHYRLGSARDEAEMMLLVDAVAGETGMGQWGHCAYSGPTAERHRPRLNVLYLDGHGQGTAAVGADGSWRDSLRWTSAAW